MNDLYQTVQPQLIAYIQPLSPASPRSICLTNVRGACKSRPWDLGKLFKLSNSWRDEKQHFNSVPNTFNNGRRYSARYNCADVKTYDTVSTAISWPLCANSWTIL